MARKRRVVKVTVVPAKNTPAVKESKLQFRASEVVNVFDHQRGEMTRVHAGALSKSNHWLVVEGDRWEIVELEIVTEDVNS